MQISNWDDYRYFLNVARAGSLKYAAQHMKVNQSTVFRRINALEESLSVKLFTRHKQGYTMTDVGESIFSEIEKVEDTVLSVTRQLSGRDIRLSGQIKISTTASIAYAWLPRYLKGFHDAYPDIKLDIEISQRQANLTRREADVVISAGNSRPDTMIGRPLGVIDFGLFAHEDYLKGKKAWKKGCYTTFEFLMPNDFFSGLKARESMLKKLDDSQIILSCDKFSGLHHFCQQGLGVGILPVYMVKESDKLVQLELLDEMCSGEIWMMTHPDLKHTVRIKAFMEYMRKAVKR